MHTLLHRTLAKFVIAFALAVCIGSCATTAPRLSTQASGVQLWINHDKVQSDQIPKAPAYIE